MRFSVSPHGKPRICSANGYIQQLVFPDPIAPRIATPVNRPLSGMTSQCGHSAGIVPGMVDLSEDKEKIVSFRGSGKRGNLPARIVASP